MIARVATVQVRPERIEDAIHVYREGVVPALMQQTGFAGAELLVNRETGHGISITRWETPEAELATETSGFYREQFARFRGLFEVMPVRETYEVAFLI
jgi:heme-degrading monooxygenase HmoA